MLHCDGTTPDHPAAVKVKASPHISGTNNSCSNLLKSWKHLSSSKLSSGSRSTEDEHPDDLRRTLISMTNEKRATPPKRIVECSENLPDGIPPRASGSKSFQKAGIGKRWATRANSESKKAVRRLPNPDT